MKDNDFKKIVCYEGVLWDIDLSGDNRSVKIIEPDGTRRPATGEDGNFMEVLNEGHIVSESKVPTFYKTQSQKTKKK